MKLSRSDRQHKTAGIVAEDYWIFKPGQRVMTVDKIAGVVTRVQDGPYPTTELYIVSLDNGLGGGEYSSNELTALPTPQANLEVESDFEPVEAQIAEGDLHTADSDYPELGSILVERPPLAHSVTATKKTAAVTVMLCRALRPTGPQYHVHAVGCPDLKGRKYDAEDCEPLTVSHVKEIVMDVYPPKSYLYDPDDPADLKPYLKDVRVFPCVTGLTAAKEALNMPLDTGGGHPKDSAYCARCGRPAQELKTSANGSQYCPDCFAENLSGQDVKRLNNQSTKKLLPLVAVNDEFVFEAETKEGKPLDRLVAPLVNRVMEKLPPEFQSKPGDWYSYDWCRFRKRRHCYFSETLDAEATKQAGYSVWVPKDRGVCPRDSWDESDGSGQKQCPLAEPGPNSGDRNALVDATVPWSQGGQRGNGVTVRRAQIEKDAAWTDVESKGAEIRRKGGVTILSVLEDKGTAGQIRPTLTVTGQVQGDTGTYETQIIRGPDDKSLAIWSCSCAWSSYSWGRTRQWTKYEGRPCAHAMALWYEVQSEEMQGYLEESNPPKEAPEVKYYEKPDRKTAGFMGKVRGEIHEVIELLPGGLARIDTGEILADSEIQYPTYHPTLGLDFADSQLVITGAKKEVCRICGTQIWRGSRGVWVDVYENGFCDRRKKGVEGSQLHIPESEPVPESSQSQISNKAVNWRPGDQPCKNCGKHATYEGLDTAGNVEGVFCNSCTQKGQKMPRSGVVKLRKLKDTYRKQGQTDPDGGPIIEAAGIAVKAEDTGRVLLHQRHLEDDSAPGTWEFIGGHVEPGEDPFEAAEREFKEETGMKLPEGKLVGSEVAESGTYIQFIYTVPEEFICTGGEDEAGPNVCAWFDPDDAEGNPILRDEAKENDWESIKAANRLNNLAELKDEPEPALPETTGEQEEEVEKLDQQPISEPSQKSAAVLKEDVASRSWLMEGGKAKANKNDNAEIAAAAANFLKTGMKSFSPAEQKALIDEGEGVTASNLDRLNIAGTHYELMEQAMAEGEDDSLWV